MAMYNTRVELHDLSGTTNERIIYEKLHQAMETAGFKRVIVGGSGKSFHLPHAEYQKETNETHDQVFDKAKSIANAVHKQNGVITWLYSSAKWIGLKEV